MLVSITFLEVGSLQIKTTKMSVFQKILIESSSPNLKCKQTDWLQNQEQPSGGR